MKRKPKPARKSSVEFALWRDSLSTLELDGENLYLPTGDIPMDENELLELWSDRRTDGATTESD